MAQSGGAPPPFVPHPSSAPASSLSSRPRLGTPLPRAGFATVPRQSGRFWTPPARSPRPTEVPSSRVGLDSPRPSPCGVAASARPGNRNGTDDKKNFYAKTIIGHVACLSAHSAGALRGAGDMTLATSAARSARRAMLTLVPRSPCVGADRARRAHGVERLPAELRVVIVVAPVVRDDARRVDARGVVR